MSQEQPNDIPVLKDVVKRGDDDVIKTARLEKEIFEELDLLSPKLQPQPSNSDELLSQTPEELKTGSLPDVIDNIIEHHTRALRQEIAELLEDRLGIKP